MGFIVTVSILVLITVSLIIINKKSNGYIFEKSGNLLIKFSKSKFFIPVLLGFIFLISFIFYAIFSIPLGSPEVELYIPGATSSQLSEVASIGRSFVNNSNMILTSVFGWLIIISSVVLLIVLRNRNKLTFGWLVFLTLIVGSIVRLVYANTTDAIFTRQHDVWSSSGYGHYGITMHIFHNFTPPPLREVGGIASLDNSYQLYHPKFAHYCYAIVMHINSLFFGNNASWTLYQSIRIFTSAISIISLLIVYLIFKEITTNKNLILLGTAFFAFSPLFFRLSAMTNNDPLVYFFMILSIYFAIRLYKNNSIFNVSFLAISVGSAMASKLSGALIAVPVAVILILIFIKLIKEKNIKKIFTLFPIFAILVFPIGLFWPIYNFINYDQPLTYVFSNLNSALEIDPNKYSFFDRFLIFNPVEYFSNVWMRLWNSNNSPIDYNIYSSMIKSSIFGEFAYMDGGLIFAILLYAINFVLILGIAFAIIFNIVTNFKKKNYFPLFLVLSTTLIYLITLFIMGKETWMYVLAVILTLGLIYLIYFAIKQKINIKDNLASILFAGIFLLFMISYISLQISHPYTCSQDFRYIGLFVLIGSFFVSKAILSIEKKEIRITMLIIIAIYCFSSIGLYTSLGF
jgi:hypothetical protein